VHTFQKDFDDYDSYQEFVGQNPEYSPRHLLESWWNPWVSFDRLMPTYQESSLLPAHSQHLPEGMDLSKYEKRRAEKRQTEAEKLEKKRSLENTKAYLSDYISENPEDKDAQSDLEKIEKELKTLA
jgi:hypothetical protein